MSAPNGRHEVGARRARLGVAIVAATWMMVSAPALAATPPCDPDNGGLTLPAGFCAAIVADNLGLARHIAVSPRGDLYVSINRVRDGQPKGGVVALRDADGDGRYERQERFGDLTGTGIALHDGFLYFASDDTVVRYRLEPGQLVPTGTPETIVSGLTSRRQHASKTFAFDDGGTMFVNIGAPSNACQADDRKPTSPGQRPCPLLEIAGGVWRFPAGKPNQTQQDGHRYSTGIRNAVAIAWNPATKGVYVVQHGRDQLDTLWPGMFTARQSADLPAEEMFRLADGANFGYPFCYYDPFQQKKVLAPEYGGDGKIEGECATYGRPILAFPAHIGPNDLAFYGAAQFPAKYRQGAFIAFHGSWNRGALGQEGYQVAFAPFANGQAAGGYEVFADGFAGVEPVPQPRDAEHRPCGLAVGPDGSLFVVDSIRGRVWRISYRGTGTR